MFTSIRVYFCWYCEFGLLWIWIIEFACTIEDPKVHCRIHNSLPLDPILNQMNRSRTSHTTVFKILRGGFVRGSAINTLRISNYYKLETFKIVQLSKWRQSRKSWLFSHTRVDDTFVPPPRPQTHSGIASDNHVWKLVYSEAIKKSRSTGSVNWIFWSWKRFWTLFKPSWCNKCRSYKDDIVWKLPHLPAYKSKFLFQTFKLEWGCDLDARKDFTVFEMPYAGNTALFFPLHSTDQGWPRSTNWFCSAARLLFHSLKQLLALSSSLEMAMNSANILWKVLKIFWVIFQFISHYT
jgi:hypothetical protein